MNINAFIVEDEPKALHILRSKVEKLFPDLDIVGVADNAKDAIIEIRNKDPDLLFLDITMPVMSGFEILTQLKNLEHEVIFVTGYDQYAVKAIKFNALGYILKPIEDEELIPAVRKAHKRINSTKESVALNHLQNYLENPTTQNNKIGIPSQDCIDFVKVEDIIHLEGSQKYTKVHTVSTTILSSYNIGEFISLLSDYDFYQVHRSHVINLIHLERYLRNGTVILSNGSSAPVSKRKRSQFLSQIKKV